MECHRRMDPLGFALEAYDPIGRFRTQYAEKQKVTTHGNFEGKDFEDVGQLKQILTAQIRPFARNLIVRIAEYAKGRPLHAADYFAVEIILEQASQSDFPLKEMVTQIAISDLITNR